VSARRDPHASRPAAAAKPLRSRRGCGQIDVDAIHAAAQPTGYAEHNGRAVRVRATRREPPDLDRFVAALLSLALAELEHERSGAGTTDSDKE